MNKKGFFDFFWKVFFALFFLVLGFSVFAIDLDGDLIDDGWEAIKGLNNSSLIDGSYDNDSDLLSNLWEFRLGFEPFFNDSDSNLTIFNESSNGIGDAFEDLDGDGVLNLYEIGNGTNATLNDTDLDGINDLAEISIYFTNATLNDTDLDGLSDFQELFVFYTNPFVIDTDFDGVNDSAEVGFGSDPNIALFGNVTNLTVPIGVYFNYSFNVNIYNESFNSSLVSVLPAGVQYVSSSNDAGAGVLVSGNNVSFDIGDVLSASNYSFEIEVFANDSVFLNSSSQISFNYAYFNYNNRSGSNLSENVTVSRINISEPDINFSVFSNCGNCSLFETFNISVFYQNNGSSVLRNASVEFLVPAGVVFLDSSLPFSFLGGDIYLVNLSDVLNGTLGNFNVSVYLNDSYSGGGDVFVNDLFEIGFNMSGSSALNVSLGRDYFGFANSSFSASSGFLEVVDNSSNVSLGGFFNSSVFADFNGFSAGNVSLFYSMPYGVNFLNASSDLSFNLSVLGTGVLFEFLNVTSGNLSLELGLFVNSSLNGGDVVYSNFSMNYSSKNRTVFTVLNSSSGLVVFEPFLLISKSIFSPVSVGDVVVFVINITNVGNSTAYYPYLTDVMPNGTDYLFSSPAEDLIEGVFNDTIRFNLSDILPNGNVLVNITANITDSYYNGSLVYANDSLVNFVNVSYYSFSNTSLSRFYFNQTNATTIVKDGAITKNTVGSIVVNSTQSARIGELFNYTILVNFTGAPAKEVYVADYLASNLTYYNSTNTYNDSALNITGSLLEWNFGNLNGSVNLIEINVTVFVNNNTGNDAGSFIRNNVNMTYKNTYGASVLKQDFSDVYIAEPNMNLSFLVVGGNELVYGDFVNVSLNLSNRQRVSSLYNSEFYNSSLTVLIPDGFIFNSSSLGVNFSNSSHLVWEFGNVSVGNDVLLNISFVLNDTYRDLSTVFAGDVLKGFVFDVFSQSISNINNSRQYHLLRNSSDFEVFEPKLSLSILDYSLRIGENVSFSFVLNLSNVHIKNLSVEYEMPSIVGFSYQNNSYNNSAFSIFGRSFLWEFGDVNLSLNLIEMNATVYVNDTLSAGVGQDYFNFFNVSFYNSSSSVFLNSSNESFYIIEPNMNVSKILQSSSLVSLNSFVNYTINVSNNQRALVVNDSFLYNSTLIDLIPSGFVFNYSSIAPNISNSTHLIWFLGYIENGSSVLINVSFKVNDSYRNNTKVLANDVLEGNFVKILGRSILNSSFARVYETNATALDVNLISPSYSLTTDSLGRIGKFFNYTLVINLSNAPANNVLLNFTLPDSVVYDNSFSNYSYNLTLIGVYNKSLIYDFGDFNSSVQFVLLNISVYLNDSYVNGSFLSDGDFILANSILNYSSNSMNYSLFQNVSFNVSESYVNMSIFGFPVVSVNDLLTYRINVTNTGSYEVYYNDFYAILPNGTEYISSTLAYDDALGARNNTLYFNLSTLNASSSLLFNVTVNVTPNYYNGSLILANDTLRALINISYFSSENKTLSKNYSFFENYTSTIQEGAIVKDAVSNITINATSAVRPGELFNFEIEVNFSGAPANRVVVADLLAGNFTYVNSTNSFNNSALNVTGDLLVWDFGDLNSSNKLIWINVTVFANNDSSNSYGSSVLNVVNMTYQNSNGGSILKQDSINVRIVEPNLNLSYSLLTPVDVGIFDELLFEFNVSNMKRSISDYNSVLYNATLVSFIPDGLIFNYSTLGVNFSNSSHLIWDFGDMEVNQSNVFNVSFYVNDSYRDLSTVFAGDIIDMFYLRAFGYSYNDNFSIAKYYFVERNSSEFVVKLPIINTSLSKSNVSIGEFFNTTFFLNLSDAPLNDALLIFNLSDGLMLNRNFSSENFSLSYDGFLNRTLIFNYSNISDSALNVTLILELYANKSYINSSRVLTTDIVTISSYLNYSNSSGGSFVRNSTVENLTIVEPNLNVSFSYGSGLVHGRGDKIYFYANVTNVGNSPAKNLSLIFNILNGSVFYNSTLSVDNFFGAFNQSVYYNLSVLNGSESFLVNLTVNLTDSYFDGSFILANDSLFSSLEVMYFSSENFEFSRNYSYLENVTLFASNPVFDFDSQTGVLINSTSAVRIGEEFNFTLFINLSESAVNNLSVKYFIPNNFTYISSNNTVNNSALNVSGNLLEWSFGDLNSSVLGIGINISVYANNDSSNVFSIPILNRVNFSYQNSNGDLFNEFENKTVFITEPNIFVNLSIGGSSSYLLGGFFNYTLNISNLRNNLGEYYDNAYNITFDLLIPDGVVFNSSSYGFESYNSTNLVLFVSNFSVNDSQIIDLRFKLNSSYRNGSSVLSGDVIDNFVFNYSYLSFLSENARYYFNNSFSLGFTVSSIDFNFISNISKFAVGEIFELGLFANTSGLLANRMVAKTNLSDKFVFDNFTSSCSFVNFSNFGNVLDWNFSSSCVSSGGIYLNVSYYFKENSSFSRGFEENFYYNLSYVNSSLSSFLVETNKRLILAEPNVSMFVSILPFNVSRGNVFNYTINVSNVGNFSLVSDLWDGILKVDLQDGFDFVGSNYSYAEFNSSNSSVESVNISFGNIGFGEDKLIDIYIYANDSYLNGSANRVFNFTSNFSLFYYSYNSSFNQTRNYSQNISNFWNLTDVKAPLFDNVSIFPIAAPYLSNVSFDIDVIDETFVDSCWMFINATNGSIYRVDDVCLVKNFTLPFNVTGKYNVTFYVNDTSGNLNVSRIYNVFVGEPANVSFDVVDENLSLNETYDFKVYFNDTLIYENDNFSGTLNRTFGNFSYDVEFGLFDENFVVKLRGVNMTFDNLSNRIIGFDEVNVTGFKKTYAVYNRNFSFFNSTVNISYANLSYTNENYLQARVCEDWNFTSRVCDGSWSSLSFNLDTSRKRIYIDRTSFSAFGIVEVIPAPSEDNSGGGGGGSSSSSRSFAYIQPINNVSNETNISIDTNLNGSCVSNWRCNGWSVCENNEMFRTCFDDNKCTASGYYVDTQSCLQDGVDDNNSLNNGGGVNFDNSYKNKYSDNKILFEKSSFIMTVKDYLYHNFTKEFGPFSWGIYLILYLFVLFSVVMINERELKKFSRDVPKIKKQILEYYGCHQEDLHYEIKNNFFRIMNFILVIPMLFVFGISFSALLLIAIIGGVLNYSYVMIKFERIKF